MVAILERLKVDVVKFPKQSPEGPCLRQRNWLFFQNLPREDLDFFRYFVKNHALINLEYSVHRTQLANDLKGEHKVSLIPQFEAALIMAEILEAVYEDYLVVPREVFRLRKEQDVYRQWLEQLGPQRSYHYCFPRDISVSPIAQSSNKMIRDQTLIANLYRHMVGRTRRFALILAPAIFNSEFFKPWFDSFDYYALPMLSYASWLFFVPRAAVNLGLTAKHLIPGPWMSETEKSLGAGTRFRAQMERRWLELGNDLAALAVNLTNCFVLIGALTPWSLYLTTVSLAYDVVLASVRSYIEISRLKTLEKTYLHMQAQGGTAQISGYLSHLQTRIYFEQLRLYSSVVINLNLLLGILLTLPVFGFPPLIPIIGAALAVLTTIAWFASISYLDKQKPSDKVLPPPEASAVTLLASASADSVLDERSPLSSSASPSGFFDRRLSRADEAAPVGHPPKPYELECSLLNATV